MFTLFVLSIYNLGYIEKQFTDPNLIFVYLHGSIVQYQSYQFYESSKLFTQNSVYYAINGTHGHWLC